MANDLRIRVGSLTSTFVFSGTDAQFAAILLRFAQSLGIPTDGTNQQNLDAIRDHIKDEVWRRSKQKQAADLRAANEAAIAVTVDTDNPL